MNKDFIKLTVVPNDNLFIFESFINKNNICGMHYCEKLLGHPTKAKTALYLAANSQPIYAMEDLNTIFKLMKGGNMAKKKSTKKVKKTKKNMQGMC